MSGTVQRALVRSAVALLAAGCSLAEYDPDLAPWKSDAIALTGTPGDPDGAPAGDAGVVADAAPEVTVPTCASLDGCWIGPNVASMGFAPSSNAACAQALADKSMDTRQYTITDAGTKLNISGLAYLDGTGPAGASCETTFSTPAGQGNDFVVTFTGTAANLSVSIKNTVKLSDDVTCELTWLLGLTPCP